MIKKFLLVLNPNCPFLIGYGPQPYGLRGYFARLLTLNRDHKIALWC
jgi:hypothetical protein